MMIPQSATNDDATSHLPREGVRFYLYQIDHDSTFVFRPSREALLLYGA
jgi:hypothetical protein